MAADKMFMMVDVQPVGSRWDPLCDDNCTLVMITVCSVTSNLGIVRDSVNEK